MTYDNLTGSVHRQRTQPVPIDRPSTTDRGDMATRKAATPTKINRRLTPDEMKAANKKLRKRRDELDMLNVESIRTDADEKPFEAWADRYNLTVEDIYGRDSAQYDEYRVSPLYDLSKVWVQFGGAGYGASMMQNAYESGIADARNRIDGLQKYYAEKLEEIGESLEGTAVVAFEGVPIHEDLRVAIGDRFRPGQFEDCVRRAYIAVEKIVQARSGRADLSGVDLMNHVFSPKGWVLSVTDETGDAGTSIREGTHKLFAGSAQAIRNPRAHTLDSDEAHVALEIIMFLSYLAGVAKGAEKV